MVKLRDEKVQRIADYIPEAKVDSGKDKGELLVLGWVSTYVFIKTFESELVDEGKDVSHLHLRHLNPFPKNLGEILHNYNKVLVPEINSGQLIHLVRSKYLIPAVRYNKIQGQPFSSSEMKAKILEIYNQ